MSVVDPIESARALQMTINRLFKSDMGEVRLIIRGHGVLEAKTLYTLCKVGIQAALDDTLLEVEEDQGGGSQNGGMPGRGAEGSASP
ncbi:hypothetical protein [Solilutibacter silvestris]|uniref:Uncharacterized protein n=1 Tax=Solilutibacter silvestris TaxID=1645665 RepID=A0A2K1Q192_9GAMM|nr:hypothetical protein [Lysobacter silvestris]PNS08801.1 hypothetical protein Lysil_0430 [Lysobacter silvestris]